MNRPCVLKVSSREIYRFFSKDFEAECLIHQKVAKDTEHVVDIIDAINDVAVSFGSVKIPCHVAVLDYVEGDPLDDLLGEGKKIPARMIAQIAVDLLRMIGEFENKGVYHNDLHYGNILVQRLDQRTRRAEAIEENIRAIAIDMGSVADGSKSDGELRLGDLHWVAQYLREMSARLLRDPDEAEDVEYRLASLLEERAYILSPSATSQRTTVPDQWTEQWIDDIKASFQQASSPWSARLNLKHFSDSYNAQTLGPWFVPHLLVDPDDQWVPGISAHGPQIISGMRGCGKTMLLRALQFHARAAYKKGEPKEKVLERLKTDQFVGLYVSCMRLLDRLGSRTEKLNEPYARLFAAYAKEALQGVRHLHEIDKTLVNKSYYRYVAEAVSDYISGCPELSSVGSGYELERRLQTILVRLSQGEGGFSLVGHPSAAFPHLAEAIAKCSPLWTEGYILFLLDDVSTRYLREANIEEILSTLIFQHPRCAFKLTTEAQTLRLALSTTALTEKARGGRDYDVFDLGAEVNEKMKMRGRKGGTFVEKILAQRAEYYPHHPKVSPRAVLGDVSLQSIAEKIVSTSDNSREKKEVYNGITALSGICVGDIGDVISIYESILRKAAGKRYPVSPSIQSECCQSFCSRRLYDLNRRESYLKDFALSFAEASHNLLMQSKRDIKESGSGRLRQYLSMYVRVTTGDPKSQFERLREIIDAGVFVLEGGSETPRTKTRDSDPIQQFKLTYRKLFGLSNFIGLSERDRFELSGKSLEEWLENPGNGKEILMRNLGGEEEGAVEEEVPDDAETGDSREEVGQGAAEAEAPQLALFTDLLTIGKEVINGEGGKPIQARVPNVRILNPEELSGKEIKSVILGLGFEDRALESVTRLIRLIKPRSAMLVRYKEKGKSDEIVELVKKSVKEVEIIEYSNIAKKGIEETSGDVLVDITGLAKPALFHGIRNVLKKNNKVWICYTMAESYYPLDAHIQKVLKAEEKRDNYALLEALRNVLTGERGPYNIYNLLPTSEVDESRRRVLCAFSSPKHERLLALLDERSYDRIELIAPEMKTPRDRLANIAAEVAMNNYCSAAINYFGSDDLMGVLPFLANQFGHWYVDNGFNFELALTGSKLQAVASAALCAIFKVSQCWYVAPQEFDVLRFTEGVGKTTFYEIVRP
ncbi:MAG: ORC-CDC6 family AAA ATPase [Desulfobacteria bacterium]